MVPMFKPFRSPALSLIAIAACALSHVPASGAGGDGFPARADSAEPPFTVLFFTQPGCPDCRQTREDLAALSGMFPSMEVKVFNILEPPSVRLSETLAEEFGVPERLRLTAPTVFTSAGFLTRDRIDLGSLLHLMEAARADAATSWYEPPEDRLAESADRIGERFHGLTLAVVLGAGLLDGLNPCAFATIIFFLSYLQVARRTPRQILEVGMAFVLGIFVTYFALGFGLLHVIGRITAIETAAIFLNWFLAAVVFVILLLSLRDGILCLRGRLSETSLQLPKPLKKAVNATIRKGVRHSRFVLAAMLTGAVIAVLELACTGQVYAPTIAFVLQSGQQRATAVAYLLLYNLAFILPLLVVMLLAHHGLTSDRLQVFFRNNVAFVKFANAALFAVLLAFFLLVLL